MSDALGLQCEQHPDPFDCPDCLLSYVPKFDEYGLIVHDGGSSVMQIAFCPWCGTRLPQSKRDRWFDALERLGFADPAADPIPDEYRSDAWWRGS